MIDWCSDVQLDMDQIGPQCLEHVSRQGRKKLILDLVRSHREGPNPANAPLATGLATLLVEYRLLPDYQQRLFIRRHAHAKLQLRRPSSLSSPRTGPAQPFRISRHVLSISVNYFISQSTMRLTVAGGDLTGPHRWSSRRRIQSTRLAVVLRTRHRGLPNKIRLNAEVWRQVPNKAADPVRGMLPPTALFGTVRLTCVCSGWNIVGRATLSCKSLNPARGSGRFNSMTKR